MGKTSLVIRYVKERFQEAETLNSPMQEDHLEKTISVEGKKCQLMIYDTGGQEGCALLLCSALWVMP